MGGWRLENVDKACREIAYSSVFYSQLEDVYGEWVTGWFGQVEEEGCAGWRTELSQEMEGLSVC